MTLLVMGALFRWLMKQQHRYQLQQTDEVMMILENWD